MRRLRRCGPKIDASERPTESARTPYYIAWVVRKNDRWYACFECERAVRPLAATNEVIGVDRGVHVLAALSDSRLVPDEAVGEKRKTATARLQRELEATTVRDGAGRVINGREHRRIKARERLARAREREANARRDYAHKVARRLVNGADVIALKEAVPARDDAQRQRERGMSWAQRARQGRLEPPVT
jgi:transposase